MNKLIVFDMDSTLINQEGIDELARELGEFEQISKITKSAMEGAIPFEQSLALRVSALKGLTLKMVENVKKRITLTPGAEALIKTLKKEGFYTVCVSGGFSILVNPIQVLLGLDEAHSNPLQFTDQGVCTGQLTPKTPLIGAEAKASLLKKIANEQKIDPSQTFAVGDGANDILMLNTAHTGIAFCAKPALKKIAQYSVDVRDLMQILPYVR